MQNIVVIGMGYVGIPCAALLADVDGLNVIGVQGKDEVMNHRGWHLHPGGKPDPVRETSGYHALKLRP